METTSRTFRIFVSSTFNDLKAERNALQERVFPKLRELCEEKGAHFQPIDLRWGVSDEASLDQQAMNICLGEVARCRQTSPRPNFIVLLGDRYGWMPPSPQIPESEFQQIIGVVDDADKELLEEWYSLDENALPPERRLNPREKDGEFALYDNWQPIETRLQRILAKAAERINIPENRLLTYLASATHQEIDAGAIHQTDAHEHVFCFMRSIKNLPESFAISEFQEVLAKRIKEEYPQGLSSSCEQVVEDIKVLKPDASPGDVNDSLKKMLGDVYKETDEQKLLEFIRQVLIDFTAADFINLNEDWQIDTSARDHLDQLKVKLAGDLGQNVFRYDSDWTNNAANTAHLDQLCNDVYNALKRIILAELDNSHQPITEEEKETHIKPRDTLIPEGLAHHKFAEERLTFFVGREAILSDIGNYINSADQRILAIVAGGGTGKSALLAKAVEQTQKAHPEAQLVYRFIGATPDSSDGRGLLYGLCQEISRCYEVDGSDIPIDYRDLVAELGKRMGLASANKPLVLFIDSLDQLSANQGARELNWLPNELPGNVRLVVSTRDKENTFENLQTKHPIILTLAGLSQQDGELLLDQWLSSKDVRRNLQPTQKKEVLDKFRQTDGNPLYLKLAFEEARLWTSYQEQEDLSPGVDGIIRENMFDRLKHEGNHGEMLVTRALGYLAASRNGLAEDELVDLLSRDLQVYTWFFQKSHHLPADLLSLAVSHLKEHPELLKDVRGNIPQDAERAALAWLKQDRDPPGKVMSFINDILNKENGPKLPIVLWSRLSFDLAPYLTERQVDGSSLLNFYHRELGDVSKSVFLAGDQEMDFHEKLAEYFRVKADPKGDGSWTGGYIHGLSELPYHLTKAGQQDSVFELLTDFKFLEHKAEEVGISRTLDENGLEQITSDGIHRLQQDMDSALATFYNSSGQSEQSGRAPLIRTAEEFGRELKVYCPTCNTRSSISRNDLGQVIICPHDGCNAEIKLNTFTVQMT